MKHRAVAAGLTLTLTLVACSSTSEQARSSMGGSKESGQTADASTTLPPPVAEESTSGPAPTSSEQAETRRSSGRAGPTKGTRGPSAGTSRPSEVADATCVFPGCSNSQGVAAKTITIGFPYIEGGDEFLAAFGAPVKLGNPRRQINAVVGDLNRRGGILGRTVEPAFAPHQAAAADPAGQDNAVCTQLTEDKKVFAVLTAGNSLGFYSCVAQHQTFIFSAGPITGDRQLFDELSPWYRTPSMKGDHRVFSNMLPLLKQRNFFSKDARVGLMVADFPTYRRLADKLVRPTLERLGVNVVDEFRVSSQQAADVQRETAQAVPRFKLNNVSHVLFVPGFSMPFFFMQNAEPQQYRPRYAFDSNSAPAILLEPLVPKEQLRGSMGLGWKPQDDVTDKHYPYTAQEKRCIDIMRAGGEAFTSRSNPAIALRYCDLIWSFEAAATKAGPDLTSGRFKAGLDGLGASWASVLTFQSDFSRGWPDAASSHRLVAFDDECSCFLYKSDVISDVP